MECLHYEQLILTTKPGAADGASEVCADRRCLQNPQYFQIHYVPNRTAPKGGTIRRVPGMLKCCNADTFTLDYYRKEEPDYKLVREYRFTVSDLYAEVFLPTHLYRDVRDAETGRRRAEAIAPGTVDDLPLGYLSDGNKLRVRSEVYDELLEFCRFSIHAHADGNALMRVCCNRLCSRPEPLTRTELRAIKRAAASEPYYACSWLEKRVLFKWHVGEERFDPFLLFDNAIAVYNGLESRHDPKTTALFAFRCWKTPDEEVTNADEIYFRSPINVAGYKWYEPTSRDRDNEVRYASGWLASDTITADSTSRLIARNVMNLKSLPGNVLLSSSLITPCSFGEGAQITPTSADSWISLGTGSPSTSTSGLGGA